MPPRLARLLAVVVAVALVAGAFALRGALADDDGPVSPGPGGRGSTGGGEGDDGDEDPAYRIVCDEDLGEPTCDAMADATGAEVATMSWSELRAADDLPYDLWLTLDPMPSVLDVAEGVPLERIPTHDSVPVASSGLSLLTFEERGIACADAGWSCVTAAVAGPGEVGVPSLGSSSGLLVLGAAARALAPELDEQGLRALDDESRDQLTELIEDAPGELREQQERIVTQRGAYAGIVTTSDLAAARVERSAPAGLEATRLAPPVTVGVVLAGLGPRGDEAVRALRGAVTGQTVRDALATNGWAGGAEASAGLPVADLVYALQEELG